MLGILPLAISNFYFAYLAPRRDYSPIEDDDDSAHAHQVLRLLLFDSFLLLLISHDYLHSLFPLSNKYCTKFPAFHTLLIYLFI